MFICTPRCAPQQLVSPTPSPSLGVFDPVCLQQPLDPPPPGGVDAAAEAEAEEQCLYQQPPPPPRLRGGAPLATRRPQLAHRPARGPVLRCHVVFRVEALRWRPAGDSWRTDPHGAC
eukprot:878361-Prorocentrum_minimum.AAC.1